MSIKTLEPAYGRDYKSQKQVQEAFDGGKDFTFFDLNSFRDIICNKSDLEQEGEWEVKVRYDKLRKCMFIRIECLP